MASQETVKIYLIRDNCHIHTYDDSYTILKNEEGEMRKISYLLILILVTLGIFLFACSTQSATPAPATVPAPEPSPAQESGPGLAMVPGPELSPAQESEPGLEMLTVFMDGEKQEAKAILMNPSKHTR